MTFARVAVAGLLAIWAAGCVNQQAEIAKYRDILNADVTGDVRELEPGEDLTLLRALLLANKDNERLAISGENFVQAWADKDRAFAAFLPTITLAPSWTITDNAQAVRQTDTATGIARPSGTSGSFKAVGNQLRRFEVPVNGSINLFRGFSDLASLRASGWTIEQRRQLLLDAQATLLLDVTQAFYNVLLAESSVDVLQKSLAAQQERVRDAQGKLKVGAGKTLDLAQAEAQAAGTRVTLVQAQGDVANGRTLLAFLIGAPEVSGPLRDEYRLPAEVGDLDPMLQEAWANREDYLAAQAAVEAFTQNVQAAIGQYYPSVTFNATGYLFRENFTDASKWNTLLSINLPIFSAGVIEADVRFAWSQLRQAAMQRSLLERQIRDEVRSRFQNFLTSAGKLRELDAQLRAAAESYRQARAGFAAGSAINLDVLSAQNVLLDSELQITTERFNQKVIYLDLLRSTGRLKLGAMQRAAATTRPTTGPATLPSAGIGTPLNAKAYEPVTQSQ